LAGQNRKKRGGIRRFLQILGVLMILAGIGCVALFFIGPPGGTAGSIPSPVGERAPAQEAGGGPADKTLYLTIPKIGLKNQKVYDSYSEESLDESAIHLPDTGFPWQPVANTYIAGHRMGYFGTDSFLVFFRLNELTPGDEITVKDSLGRGYDYRVTEQMVVGPEDVQVMDPVAGESTITLQTCTLPDYSDRLIVRGEMVS
jgi:sortase A